MVSPGGRAVERPAVDTRSGQPDAPGLVGVVWALLVVNALGSLGVPTIVPVPRPVLQMITMGALGLAFALALVLNPRIRIRPSAFLLLLSLLVLISVASSLRLESGPGALMRSARLTAFVATLWLLTPWWDGRLTFVRYHVRAIGAVLGTVALGLILAPGLARPADFQYRLVGVIWPITATQVADYAAVLAGLVLVLWLAGRASSRSVLAIGLPALGLLILTHTRTATVGLVVAVLVAGLTLSLSYARARRALIVAGVSAGFLAAAFAVELTTWFQRGQDEDALADLTGRQRVWDALLSVNRDPYEQILGVGLTDKSFGGLAIDSTWLSVYHEQGFVGVAVVALIVIVLVFTIAMSPPSAERACAAFLIVYCMIASYTQTGLGDVSSYLLHFTVAATLLSSVRSRDATARPTVPYRRPDGCFSP